MYSVPKTETIGKISLRYYMKELIKRIKKYKIALFILLIIILGIISMILTRFVYEYGAPQDVIIRPPEITEPVSPEEEENIISVIKESPVSGSTEKKFNDRINIHFNKPIDLESLEYSVSPEISLAFRTYDEENKILTIFPNVRIWNEALTYRITILNLEGPEETSIKSSFNYTYRYDPVPVDDAGESWLLDDDIDPEILEEYMRGHHEWEGAFD